MALRGGGGGWFFFLLLAVAGHVAWAVKPVPIASFNRSSFPASFTFGASSSAYQYEGAAREGGRGPSIWDGFTHHPGKIADGNNGDMGINSYHLYKEDVKLLKNMGMDAYRFSISWPRILPNGSISGGINKVGIQYYNNLINELISKGLKPYVTLFHWDLPQGLEDQYGGFRSPRVADDFRDYASICFKEFGDRVKHWITLNEPWSFAQRGYAAGIFAPGRCSPFEEGKCKQGDSAREPYLVAHHLLLAHAAAVKIYRDKYQTTQNGMIGITLVTNWFIPYSKSKADSDAFGRAIDFMFGWFMDPLTQGDYPFSMRAVVRDRLPQFTRLQSEMVKGSYDFLGLNYYTANYAKSMPLISGVNMSYNSDMCTLETGVRNGVALAPSAPGTNWFYIYPRGIRDLLVYIKNKYNNPIIYITENGIDETRDATLPLEKALKDDIRVDYHRRHLTFLQMAIRDGVDVRGYFVWSLCDDYEWEAGYSVTFGLNYVDHKDNFKRYPKTSALWFTKFLKG